MNEEEAIERCNELIKESHSCWIGITNQEAIYTVLNLIDKQQAEIEDIKIRKERQLNRFSKYKENIENKHEEIYEDLVQEIEKKDKIIDLMAEYIKEPYRVIAFGSRKPKTEIIKEYFKNKVKESK